MKKCMLAAAAFLLASCANQVWLGQPEPAPPPPPTPIVATTTDVAPVPLTPAPPIEHFVPSTAPAPATHPVVGVFYQQLLPYGEWAWQPWYGWVWCPYGVPLGWRPYTHGHWARTDCGWTWASDWPWGWACFHYGRWFFDSAYGWAWVPGTVWAPSWVVWRTSSNWIGWAPMPPVVVWRERGGLDLRGAHLDRDVPHHHFCFVEGREFLRHDLRDRILPPARNVAVLHETRAFVDYRVVNRRVVNRLPVEAQLGRTLGHPVPQARLVEAGSPPSALATPPRPDEVRVFRPEFRPAAGRPARVAPPTPLEAGERRPPAVPRPGPQPPELLRRHEAELRAVEAQHAAQRRALEEQFRTETQRPPAGMAPNRVRQFHNDELRAYEEQVQRERQLLQRWHERERDGLTPRVAPPVRRYNVPGPPPGPQPGPPPGPRPGPPRGQRTGNE